MTPSMLSLAFAGLLLASPAMRAAEAPATATCMARSAASLDALARGDYALARKDFSPAVAQALDAGKLKQAWTQLQGSEGTYSKHEAPQRGMFQGHPVVVTPMTFSGAKLDVLTACDANDQLTAFRFLPAAMLALVAQAGGSGPVQAQVEPDGVRLRPQAVPSPLGPLKGALTLPAGKGPFPAVVLVAGSGNQDMDETIGPNKPFRDIADGLARAGIASLRYDKRTLDYPQRWGDKGGYVIDAEVTNDAVAAAHMLAGLKDIDPHRVFVLGHSLGAMMAPRIGRRDPQLAGLVMLAAPARPILDALEQQTREQGARQGLSSEAVARQVNAIVNERKLLAKAGKGPAPAGEFMGGSQGYWQSWSQVEQVDTARSLSMPMLFLQGDSDFQVSPEHDFARWEAALAGKPQVTFQSYPGLSHLFTPAGKTGTIDDYARPEHVDARVIADIASWIKAQPGTPSR